MKTYLIRIECRSKLFAKLLHYVRWIGIAYPFPTEIWVSTETYAHTEVLHIFLD